MSWQFTLLSTPILLAATVSAGIFGYILTVYRDRLRDPVVVIYLGITVAAVVWTGLSALKLLQTEPATKLLLYRLLHIGAAALPPLLFLFVVAITDRKSWLRSDVIGAVFLVPVLFLVVLFFDSGGLIIAGTTLSKNDLVVLRVADGPGFLLFSIYSTVLVVATLGLVLSEIRRLGPAYYPQALLIAIAVSTPMLFSLLTTVGIPPFDDPGMNLVPTSGAVSTVSFGVLLYRYRVVDLPPLAHATAMKYSPDALFVLDRSERIVSTNEHGSDLLEALPGALGSPLSKAVSAFDPETSSSDLIEITSPAGEVTYHRVFIEPLTRGGTRLGWVVVFRDETVQQNQLQRLEETNEQMELLASTISHDLRNPLNVAEGYLQLAQDECQSDELDKVEQAHTRMGEIIDEVLTLARAGHELDDLDAVPMAPVVERAWENVSTDAADLTVDIDRTVMADRPMLHRAFENLFRNAVEHGGSDVTVTVGNTNGGMYVEDDGAGIPSNEREEVFAVGFSGSVEGTGLGLNIVEQIVTAHDWTIEVTDGPDGGARFEISGIEYAS